MISKILETIKKNLFLIILIILISLLSFQLGRISNKMVSQPIKIEKANVQEIFSTSDANLRIDANDTNKDREVGQIDFRVVVSKKSTSKKFHYLWCPGAKQIKEENKIYFDSEEEAVAAGYTLAGNCTK